MNVVNVVPMSGPNRSSVPSPPPHVPVMAREVVGALGPRPGGTYVDATLGAGGHAALLLEAGAALVIGIDRDRSALALARSRLGRFGARVRFAHAAFADIGAVCAALGVEQVDGILADLGVSSMQLDDAARGMSFRGAGPLDMRMDQSRGITAAGLLAELDDERLAEVIGKLGGERRARRVARCIKQALGAGELHDTADLRRAVVRAVGPARVGGVDPATRTFQALRMAVNGELDQLGALIDAAPGLLGAGAVLAIISFHSLEDRIVKRALRASERWEPIGAKPLTAAADELARNPRSRSAKLRAARRREAAS
jgi:16S rRNA (cytosine1402-N4)-methyltransferase